MKDCDQGPDSHYPVMRRSFALLLVVTAGAWGCRDVGRTPDRTTPRTTTDSGVVQMMDAGSNPDAGFVDAGSVFQDAQVVDTGTNPPLDSGQPVDAGTPTATHTVYDVQDPSRPNHPAEDQVVQLAGVVVTAVAENGNFWVQDPAGGPYSGVLVYKPSEVSPTGVMVGDRVALTGTFTEYFDLTEVVLTSLDSAMPGAPLGPMTVPAVDLANGSSVAEMWEGVLVRVDSVTVLDDMPDAPDDFGEWVVTGGLRIDDFLFALEPRPTTGSTFTAIVGIHNFGFENYKIEPRDAADFVR